MIEAHPKRQAAEAKCLLAPCVRSSPKLPSFVPPSQLHCAYMYTGLKWPPMLRQSVCYFSLLAALSAAPTKRQELLAEHGRSLLR